MRSHSQTASRLNSSIPTLCCASCAMSKKRIVSRSPMTSLTISRRIAQSAIRQWLCARLAAVHTWEKDSGAAQIIRTVEAHDRFNRLFDFRDRSRKVRFREDAKTNTRAACAPQTYSLQGNDVATSWRVKAGF